VNLCSLEVGRLGIGTITVMTNDLKCRDTDYIDFIIASPRHFSCTEAAKVQPEAPDPPAHDAFTRLLHRLEPDPETLWPEARPLVHRKGGVLVLDDSTLDKHYAKKIDLVTRHWSGKHHAVVRGIHLTTLLWTDGDRHIPCDYRLYDVGTRRRRESCEGRCGRTSLNHCTAFHDRVTPMEIEKN